MSATTARAATGPPEPLAARQPRCVCIDIETPHTGEPVVHKLAAFRPDTGARVLVKGSFSAAELRGKLDELADGAAFVLGHNVRRHDLPVLAQLYPGLALHGLPVVDTLELSPLAFPENPYHRLVKDYKLVSDARNDPLRDAELSLTLFLDEQAAFRSLAESRPDDVALFPSACSSYHREKRETRCYAIRLAIAKDSKRSPDSYSCQSNATTQWSALERRLLRMRSDRAFAQTRFRVRNDSASS